MGLAEGPRLRNRANTSRALPDALSFLWPQEQWQRNQNAIVVATFIAFLAFSVMSPILPLYVQDLGVRDLQAASVWSGLLFGISPLIAAFLGPFWGMLADRLGRKLIIQRSLAGFALVFLLMSFAQNVYHLLGLRIAVGVFGGFGPMSIALVASTAPPKRTSRAIGTVQAAQILGQALGPALGGFLADTISIRGSFFVTATLSASALMVATLLYKEGLPTRGARGLSKERVGVTGILRLPSLFAILLVLFLVQFINQSFGPQIPLFVSVLGADPQYVGSLAGLVISLGAAGGAISATCMGRLASRHSAVRLLLASLVAGAVACLPIAAAGSVWQLLALRTVLGLAVGGTLTLGYSIADRYIPSHIRSTGYATLGSGAQIGGAISPMVGGALAAFNIRSIFLVDAALYLAATGWVLAALPVDKPAGGTAPAEGVADPATQAGPRVVTGDEGS